MPRRIFHLRRLKRRIPTMSDEGKKLAKRRWNCSPWYWGIRKSKIHILHLTTQNNYYAHIPTTESFIKRMQFTNLKCISINLPAYIMRHIIIILQSINYTISVAIKGELYLKEAYWKSEKYLLLFGIRAIHVFFWFSVCFSLVQ